MSELSPQTGAQSASGRLITRPLIIVGAPRSGTTMLFQALSTHPDLWSLYRESQQILDPYFKVEMTPGSSALVTAEDTDEATARAVERAFYDAVGNVEHEGGALARRLPLILRTRLSKRLQQTGQARKRPPLRMVEKTPDNCFRLGMLRRTFPDAKFIFVLRDPRGSIASIYHGWRDENRFRRYAMPADFRIEDYTGREWCFGLPPGWESQNGRRLIEVCAFQWNSYIETCMRDLPEGEANTRTVRYEDLASEPGAVLDGLAEWAGLDPEPLRRYRDKLPVVNTWTRPSDDKWRRFEDEISTVKEAIEPLGRRLGYDVGAEHPVSGD